MVTEDFSEEYIQDTYQKLIHISDDGYLVNGTGSYISPKIAGITYTTSSYALSASYVEGYVSELVYQNDSSSFDYRISNISVDTSSFVKSNQTSSMFVSGSDYSTTSSYSETTAKVKRLHDWDNPYDYNGFAPWGSLETDAVWTITRITINLAGVVTNTNTLTNAKWSERL